MAVTQNEISIRIGDVSVKGDVQVDGRFLIVSSAYGTTRINLGVLKLEVAVRKILQAQYARYRTRKSCAMLNREGYGDALAQSV